LGRIKESVDVGSIDLDVDEYLADVLYEWNGGGWGDGEGAFGFVRWDVAKDEIMISLSNADRHEGPSKEVVVF